MNKENRTTLVAWFLVIPCIGFSAVFFGCSLVEAQDANKGAIAVDVKVADSKEFQPPKPLLLYDFNDGEGNHVSESVQLIPGADLQISDTQAVSWFSGGLEMKSATQLVLNESSSKVTAAIKKSRSLSVEAWIESSDRKQSGPARIVTISSDPSHRNFTLGQDGAKLDFRLRTARRDQNGMPSTSTPNGTLATGLMHVMVTRDNAGQLTIYQNGSAVTHSDVPGDLGNWDDSFHLVIGNEAGGGRPWIGKLHRIAIYDQCVSAEDTEALYRAGPEGTSQLTAEQVMFARQSQHFREQVAPILANHCLECHDAAIHQGGLDLSSKFAWEKGGDSGLVFQEGSADESLFWQRVSSDEMPHDRPALTSEEKEKLHHWLDAGAIWPIERIDPAVFLHQVQHGEVWVQRLTVPEYISTVKATFDVDIESAARSILPPDVRADGFSNTAYNMGVDFKHIEAYRQLAEQIVQELDVLQFASKFSNSRKLSTDDTMREQVAKMGRWVLRGEITEAEQNDYCGIATTVASVGGNFEMAISYVLEAMLQSPRFIYRIEYHQGGGASRAITEQELANRMSYILWGASPDQELVRLADNGQLRSPEVLHQQMDRMLSDDRAIHRSLQFIDDWLNLGRLTNLRPDAQRFPLWNEQLAKQMRQETLDFFVEVIWEQGRPVSDLLNAQLAIVPPQLASFYGFAPRGDESPSQYDLSEVASRGGLLTQGSVLTIGGDNASMVSRGLLILHDLLRGVVNAPPPCVNTTPPDTAVGLTQRAIAEARIADETCGVCHSRFEPLAFGLERFNGIGAYLEFDEHGNRLRDDGEVLIPGTSKAKPYSNVAEMMDLLAASERVRESLTWKIVQFSLGRPLSAEDAESVLEVHQQSQQGGGGYRAIMRSLIQSELVQKTWTEAAK